MVLSCAGTVRPRSSGLCSGRVQWTCTCSTSTRWVSSAMSMMPNSSISKNGNPKRLLCKANGTSINLARDRGGCDSVRGTL
ncbi:hypothetical protein CY34DRAFT_490358 [Suillus luteus UH-Slu-Lm8-n1]|uniref:Uncharacterized protein n=1 Tax=Suillus luteus UH-Slu-Lm8-n1 TaxID=930992 RepID=A0A0D0AFD8_9AGAM|nr:hypothetical protein CY34DRAFT_490358 [Suillus luteus UH-Slu-Lm8-n1]